MAKDLLAVRIEAHGPETHPSHELLGPLELSVTTEDGVDELAATVLAHLDLGSAAALLLRGLPHVVLADLEELVEALPEALARFEELVHEVSGGGPADAWQALFGSLDFAGKLYK